MGAILGVRGCLADAGARASALDGGADEVAEERLRAASGAT
jgi:hypothetical protein